MSRAGGSSTRAPRMAWSRRNSTIATSRRAIWARGGSCADEGARRSRVAGARRRGTVLRAAGPLGAAPPGIVVNGRVSLDLLGVGPLRAGAGKVRIALGPNPILGGYPGRRRADDASEPVYARAVALEVEGLRALIASIDTVIVPGSLEEEVM